MDDRKTYFAPGTVFEGTVTAPGDVQVDGEVKGEIISEGKVSIHKMGDASIAARDLELLGAVIKGDITVGGEVTVDADVLDRARLAVQRMIDLPPPVVPST